MPDTTLRDEAVSSETFLFEVDGVTIGRFLEVSGLEVDIAVEEYEEGGQNGFVHKFPGRMSWPNITLKRGVTNNDDLLVWLNKTSGDGFAGEQNKLTRSTAAITLVSSTNQRIRSWEFEDAFPIKWTGPSFAAGNADMATEELELAHHGFRASEVG